MLYILNISASVSLTNGFRYIKELLMQHHNYHMNECHETLLKNGIQVSTVKTDAFTISEGDLEKAKQLLNFKVGIGNWRVSKTEDIKFPYVKLEMKENTAILVEDLVVNNIELTLKQEYDVKHLCEQFELHRRVMIRAMYAGSGKSYCCEHMTKMGHRVLFVCPTNVLCIKYGVNGITLNKFFGLGMTETSKMARFNDFAYDTIVFDEVFFYSVRKLGMIKRYCDEHPEKIVLATGDTNQLETIDVVSNQLNPDDYTNYCLNSIFKNLMFFQRG